MSEQAPTTLKDFLNQDLDDLIMRNPELASTYKAIITHAVDEAKKRGKHHIEISPIFDHGDEMAVGLEFF